MENVMILLKILIYSVLGYYILSILGYKKSPFMSTISPLYGLFSLLAIFTSIDNIPTLFITGIFWGITISTFAASINNKLQMNINVLWFGLLNIINYYLLDGLIERFILSSSLTSITFLFIIGLSFALMDIALTLRRLL